MKVSAPFIKNNIKDFAKVLNLTIYH